MRARRLVLTTDSAHAEPGFPNLVPDLRPDGPNQLWVADLTYMRLERAFAYVAVILDAWSRKVAGCAVEHVLDACLPLTALEAALESRRPPPGLVHHSDRRVQYASRRYRERLAEAGLRGGSMSRTGNAYDNAHVESFLKTLKHEEVYLHDYASVEDAINRLPHFLERSTTGTSPLRPGLPTSGGVRGPACPNCHVGQCARAYLPTFSGSLQFLGHLHLPPTAGRLSDVACVQAARSSRSDE